MSAEAVSVFDFLLMTFTVGVSVYGAVAIFSQLWPKPKAFQRVSAVRCERRSGVDDNQVEVKLIAVASENMASERNYVSVQIDGPWFTRMTLREAPYKHTEVCRVLTDVGLMIVQFYGPPPGTHISGDPFVWAVCFTLDEAKFLAPVGAELSKAVFKVTANNRLELIESNIFIGVES